MTAAPHLWAGYLDTEKQLTAAGVPPTSDWWLAQIERFYMHPTALRFVARVGRGGAKSWVSRRTALVEILFGGWRVPPGERHWHVAVSNRLDEARQGVGQMAAWLNILGVPHAVRGEQIELADLPLGYWALPCGQKQARGPRAIGSRKDEMCTWQVDGVSPAEDVDTSLDAMAITQPEARTMLVSSPMGRDDYHAKMFALGDNDQQLTAYAESWIANPGGITEASAWRAAKGQQRIFDREYRAIPQNSAVGAFSPADIEACRAPLGEYTHMSRPIVCVDSSDMRRDSWAFMVLSMAHRASGKTGFKRIFNEDGHLEGWTDYTEYTPTGESKIVIRQSGGWDPVPGVTSVSADHIVSSVSALCKKHGIRAVVGDHRDKYTLESMFRAHGVNFIGLPWSQPSKQAAVDLINMWLAERQLVVPGDEKLISEFHEFGEFINKNGSVSYEARRGHDDRISCLLTYAMAYQAGLVPKDFPWAPRRPRVSFPKGFCL